MTRVGGGGVPQPIGSEGNKRSSLPLTAIFGWGQAPTPPIDRTQARAKPTGKETKDQEQGAVWQGKIAETQEDVRPRRGKKMER